MRLLATGLVKIGFLATACAALSGCVDPAHSRFANTGPCEISVGSHMCTSEDDTGGHALTANGDAALHQFSGAIGGGR